MLISQSMKNGALGAANETQMNTQLFFCIQVNKQWSNMENISLISIFPVPDLPQNNVKIRRQVIFPILRYIIWQYLYPLKLLYLIICGSYTVAFKTPF